MKLRKMEGCDLFGEEELCLLNRLKNRLDHKALVAAVSIDEDRTKSKYLEVDKWFSRMWVDVEDNGLQHSQPLDILDIGTGPGFFPLMCRELGHNCIGLDKPGQTPFYKYLRTAAGTTAIEHRISPFGKLPPLPSKFDLVTAIRSAFNVLHRESRLWNLEEWSFFLDDLRDNVLKPEGRFFLRMNKKYPYDGLSYGSRVLMDTFKKRGAVFKGGRVISFEPLR
jgi:SAM-dependent methyltransferase